MAKIDRSILQANDQSMGQYGDPDKIESSITHLADKIDENDNDITTLKTDNTSNKERLTILESDVSTLETENTSNKTRISTNESNIAYNEGRLVELLRNEQKASEVVDARLGFPVLRDKLKSVDTQLAESTQRIIDQSFSVSLSKHLRSNNNIFEDALESAIAELPEKGGEITLPLGYHFTMTRTVTITKNNVVLKQLAAYLSNNITTTTPNLTMFKIMGYGFRCENINITGDGLDERGEGATTIPFEVGDGINANLDNFTLTNCTFLKCKKNVIKTRNFIIENNLFSWMDTCLEIEGVASTTQQDRRDYFIQHNRFHVSNIGINFAGTVAHSEVLCNDNIFDRNNYDIIGCIDESSIKDNLMMQTKADSIKLIGVTEGKTILNRGNDISNNTITGWVGVDYIEGYGIVTDVANSKISDNSVKRKGKDGIRVYGANSNVSDNTVLDNDFFGASAYSGIRISANGCLVDGNVTNRSHENSTQQYGVYIDDNITGTQLGINTMVGNKVAQVRNTSSFTLGFVGEGLSRSLRFGAVIPNASEGQRGDIVYNKVPTEQGTAGSRYIVFGWQKAQDLNSTINWVELRALTGR